MASDSIDGTESALGPGCVKTQRQISLSHYITTSGRIVPLYHRKYVMKNDTAHNLYPSIKALCVTG